MTVDEINEEAKLANQALENKLAAIKALEIKEKDLLLGLDKKNKQLEQLDLQIASSKEAASAGQEKHKKINTEIAEADINKQKINKEFNELKKEYADFSKIYEDEKQNLEKLFLAKKEEQSTIELLKSEIKALEDKKLALNANLDSIYQTTEVASKKEKELLVNVEKLKQSLESLKAEEEAQCLLIQKVKEEQAKLNADLLALAAEMKGLKQQHELEEKRLQAKLEAGQQTLKDLEMQSAEKLAVIKEAEARLEARITHVQGIINKAKAEKLLAESFKVV